MNKAKLLIWRTAFVGAVALALAVVMSLNLARLQLSAALQPGSAVKSTVKTKSYTVTTQAMRGQVYDRYGRPLITNTVIYNTVIDYALWDRSNQNENLLNIISVLADYGIEHTDLLPLSEDGLSFTENWQGEKKSTKFQAYLKERGWSEELDAQELFSKLSEHYNIPREWSNTTARTVVGIHYEFWRTEFSTIAPYLLVKDIDQELISVFGDMRSQIPALRIAPSFVRGYETEYAAHILGRVGTIFAEEYEALSAKGYKMNDIVGKDGAEKAFEESLRGIDGTTRYLIDEDGRVVEIAESTEAKAGDNIMLTLDLSLQKVLENALRNQIESMRAEALEDEEKPQDVEGGAAVVIDVNTGEILAIASYPTYDITRFSELYNEMLEDPYKPMFNRALSGIYSPGSVFKMVTSIAGLELGIIKPDTIIVDTGRYTYYKDYQPTCWIYSQYGITHGPENVVSAIRDSCNVFFFDVGRQIGIEKLSEYAMQFGFGALTGVELPGEMRGYVASPSAKRALNAGAWVDGDTLQAAIGQAQNLFTPLQMANYIATLVNGGTRYETHLLKYVCAHDFSSIVSATQSVISNRIEMSETTYKTVMEGMWEVTENGTAAQAFRNYPIHVGGKTGSAQVSKGTANGVFCAFAPFEKPEIAVVVVVEHGGSGNKIAPVARSVFDAYFSTERALELERLENMPLS